MVFFLLILTRIQSNSFSNSSLHVRADIISLRCRGGRTHFQLRGNSGCCLPREPRSWGWYGTRQRCGHTQLSPARIESILAMGSRINIGHAFTVKQFKRLLGLMAAASNVIPFGLLYIGPLQTKVFSSRGNPFRMIRVTHRCLRALSIWKRDLGFCRKAQYWECHFAEKSFRQTHPLRVAARSWTAALREVCGRPSIPHGT